LVEFGEKVLEAERFAGAKREIHRWGALAPLNMAFAGSEGFETKRPKRDY
jgi:hypothetical protein